ncbi:hypothetical protein [Microbulbifer sp. S227A]|uniref:hypothetical protein n=1 Tax=Microbulbifer sp. S227A TaxID=3415131 RepID=UPI003C7AA5CB
MGDHAAFEHRFATRIKDASLDPGIIRVKADRPEHRGDARRAKNQRGTLALRGPDLGEWRLRWCVDLLEKQAAAARNSAKKSVPHGQSIQFGLQYRD